MATLEPTFQTSRDDLARPLPSPSERHHRVPFPDPSHAFQSQGGDEQVRRQLGQIGKRHRGLKVRGKLSYVVFDAAAYYDHHSVTEGTWGEARARIEVAHNGTGLPENQDEDDVVGGGGWGK